MVDYGFSFRGLNFGAGTDYDVIEAVGLYDRVMGLLTPDLPRYHGGLIGASYHEPRIITLTIEAVGDAGADLAGKRTALMKAFQPLIDTEEPLTFQLPGEPEKIIWCRPDRAGTVVNVESEFGVATADVVLVASDPAIYSSALITATLEPFTSPAGLSYPVVYPKLYGAGGSGGGTVITNVGDWEAWPVFRIAGPSSGTLADPIIESVTSGSKLELTSNGGVSIVAGQTLVIDTHPARRTIEFETGASRYGRLSAASVWFALVPGDNELRFRASGATAGATCTVEARSAWI